MSIYDTLNSSQKEAVLHTKGPLLILAGAGSGKTRVLTHRVAYLIQELGVKPWNILAITFTNKAAGEMRERVDKLVEFGAESVWVSTFHSTCVRILRRYIEYLGYESGFSIYDTEDQKTLMRQILKRMNVDTKQFRERNVLSRISSAKDELITPEQLIRNAGEDYWEKRVGEIYQEYQNQLKSNNALDFDDLIVKTVELFRSCPQILEHYQERFLYIMIDEYQDTNTAQFELVSLLASKYKNLCVVGDDDQSIYKFRGANIDNILNFEQVFPGARVIKLEQNYRSTPNILDTANRIIRNNQGRKDKTLFTENENGPQVRFCQYDTAYDEADAIARDIKQQKENGCSFQDCAVLYRTNAQSRLLEEKCIFHNIPYRMIGGVNFYQRKEIKDILAYLKTIANGQDDLAVLRIINVPKRGIGTVTTGRAVAYASEQGISVYEAFRRVSVIPGMGKAAAKIEKFVQLIQGFRSVLETGGYSIEDLIDEILESTGYVKELEEEGEIEAQTRLENIKELVNKAASYSETAEEPTLNGFLEEVALVADVDSLDQSEDRVTLMTLHSAKGLEFDRVYLAGMEDGLFPGTGAIYSEDATDLEEERRLCYVGITRARKRLMLTAARQRMVNGETRYCGISRFVEEIPSELLDMPEQPQRFGRQGCFEKASDQKAGYSLKTPPFSFYSSPYGVPWADQTRGDGSGMKASGGQDAADTAGQGRTPGSSQQGAGPGANPGFGKAFSVRKPSELSYRSGDRVAHVKFGHGTVLDIKDGGKDYEVTVEFDHIGVKRMFASFAKLKKQ